MKKLFLTAAFAVLILALFALPSAAAELSATLDGETIECVDVNGNAVPPLLIDGTTYLPVRAVSNALNLTIDWDDDTKSVLINGEAENAALGDSVNIYIAGVKFTPKNVNGDTVDPIILDGTTYLPIRAIGEAFDKNVTWDQETLTAVLTTPAFKTDFEEDKVYAIISKANGKAISVLDSGLGTAAFGSFDYQAFKLIPASHEGYYNVQSVYNEKNFDVNGNSKSAGASIITYTPGTADNQMFAFVETDNGIIIYARSSKLPIEDSADKVKQNTLRGSVVQLWEVVEVEPVSSESAAVYRTIECGNLALSNSDSLKAEAISGSDAQKWILTPDSDAEYIITNAETGKSLDVANNSTTPGDPIITYQTSGDDNQRWVFEKNDDGTYLIRSVHSNLYLTISEDNTIIHAERDENAKQTWTLTITE